MPEKPSIKKSYSIPNEDFIVFGDAILRAIPLLLNDRSAPSQNKTIEDYFTRGFNIFNARLNEFRTGTVPLTRQREKELLFMLDALISAKRMLEEKL